MKKRIFYFMLILAIGVLVYFIEGYYHLVTPEPVLCVFTATIQNAPASIGQCVKLGDMGGVGVVVGRGRHRREKCDFIKVRVREPFWGCAKGQVIAIAKVEPLHNYDIKLKILPDGSVMEHEIFTSLYPSWGDRIVFAVNTNFSHAFHQENRYWLDERLSLADKYRIQWYFPDFTPSWWKPDEEGGYPTLYFTNLIHAAHTQPNWTNYYEICRDGVSMDSNRVKEDLFYDLRWLMIHGTDEELEFMDNDPLFPANNRPFLEEQIQKRQQNK